MSSLTERVSTGIAGLDTVLKGGLLRAGIYVIMGPPGAGKTITGNQMAFHHVAKGGKAVYMTLLAEAHDRMLAYIRSMSYFTPDPVPDRLKYISGFSMLEEGGLAGLLDVIRREVLATQATLLVLDGFMLAGQYKESEIEIKKLIHSLQAFAALAGCTIVLLTIKERTLESHPGYTMVDGFIELTEGLVGPRSVRELQVRKVRGTSFLHGKHTFEITGDGMVVYPRTEVLLAHPPRVSGKNRDRKAFGVPTLDGMLGGGLVSGSMTTLLGAPGTGKTLLGLSFLADGAAKGEPGIYFGFYEPPERLFAKAGNVGISVEAYCEQGLIDVVWQPPLEHLLDGLAERLLRSVETRKAKRVFIDGLEGFKSATVYPDRIGAFLAALTNELRSRDVTAIFSEETDLFKHDIEMPVKELAAVIENIIFLRHVEMHSHLYRLLSILKVRESAYDASIRQFFIRDSGIEVASAFRTQGSLLRGQAEAIQKAEKARALARRKRAR